MLRRAPVKRDTMPSAMADLEHQFNPLSALQLLLAQQKTVFVAVAVSILAYDIAARVDII